MQTLLGINLETPSIKIILLDTGGEVIGIESQKYDVEIPTTNCAEQNPDHRRNTTTGLCSYLKKKYQEVFGQIRGIGLSSQMHGFVTVDKQGDVLRSAVIWLDQRSCEKVEEINQDMMKDERKQILHNHIYPGFTFPSLLRIKRRKPDLYGQISKIIQPKDYIRYKLIDYVGTDVSDASATAMLDVRQREWVWAVIRRSGIPEHIFADCYESTEITEMVTSESTVLCGLQEGTPVMFGCRDQVTQSIGSRVIGEGCIVSNIGAGGQISACADKDIHDRQLRTHAFCHALNHAYAMFSTTLSCGLSLKWLTNQILEIDDFEQRNELASQIAPGSDGIIYLPYLSGGGTPIMNAHAKGVIYGFKLEHDKRHTIRAVAEGVIYSPEDSPDLLRDTGIRSNLVIASGGGSMSDLLLQMQVDIFEKQIRVYNIKRQAYLGAYMLTGVGAGVLKDIESASRRSVTFSNTIYEPDPRNCRIYRESFKCYHELYNSIEVMIQDEEEIMKVFGRLSSGLSRGDSIPFYYDDTYHLFFLSVPANTVRYPERTRDTQQHMILKDLVNWEELPPVLLPGKGSAIDANRCWTGSVLYTNHKYHIFYAGYHINAQFPQTIYHAASDDSITWVKDKKSPYIVPGIRYHESIDQRNPYVFYSEDDGCYWILIATKKNSGPSSRRGVVVLYTTKDLVHFEHRGPIYEPCHTNCPKCPEMYKMGNHWYLVYSRFSERAQTLYRVSRSPYGPQRASKLDGIDGHHFYAAKSLVGDNGRRFYFAWIRGGESRANQDLWQTDGDFGISHEVIPMGDGNLRVVMLREVCRAFKGTKIPYKFILKPGSIKEYGSTSLEINSAGTLSYGYSDIDEPEFMMECIIKTTDPTDYLSLSIKMDEDLDSGYLLVFNIANQQASLNKLPAPLDLSWSTLSGKPVIPPEMDGSRVCEKPFPFKPRDYINIRVVMCNDLIEILVGDTIVFSYGNYTEMPYKIGVFAQDCGMEYHNLAFTK